MSQLVRTTSTTFARKRGRGTSSSRSSSGKRSRSLIRFGIPRAMRGPVPDKMRVCLVYCDQIRNNVATASYIQELRMNSVFDPDYTNAGHQPLGFDQWATFYGRYCVYKFRITYKLTFVDSTAYYWISSSAPQNSLGAGLNALALAEQPEARGPDWHMVNEGDVNRNSVRIHTVDLPKFVGKSLNSYLTDDRYQALVSTNPSEAMGYQIRIQTADGIKTGYYDLTFKLEQWVEFSDMKQLAQS